MRFLKRLLYGLIFLVILLALGSYLLPQKQHVERSVEISASAATIYPYLANPKLFREWSPWSKMDPDMAVEYIGPEAGQGAGMSWQSTDRKVGSGSWIISQAVENQSLNVDMDFGEQGSATSFFSLKPSADKTEVVWGFDTDAGYNPMKRWFGLVMDEMVGGQYEKGLLNLKAMLEKNPEK